MTCNALYARIEAKIFLYIVPFLLSHVVYERRKPPDQMIVIPLRLDCFPKYDNCVRRTGQSTSAINLF